MVDRVPVLAIAWPVDDVDVYVQLFPLTQLDQAFRFLSTVLTAGVLLSGLLGVAIGLWAGRSALRPLTELTTAASRVAGGDLQARLPVRDDPDLASLARTFNATADALERRVREDARFAGDVSHELRSPLTTMANAGAVLSRRREELTGTGGRALDLLLSEVARFQRMVVDLMEITRDRQVDEVEGEIVDLAELVDNVAAVQPARVPEIEVCGQAPLVLGDRRRLDRVVANLLENADRYGGGAVRIGVLRRDAFARIEVDDAGPGVPNAFRRADLRAVQPRRDGGSTRHRRRKWSGAGDRGAARPAARRSRVGRGPARRWRPFRRRGAGAAAMTGRSWARWQAGVAAIAIVAVLPGCGVDAQSAPVAIVSSAQPALPTPAVNPQPTATPTTPRPTPTPTPTVAPTRVGRSG